MLQHSLAMPLAEVQLVWQTDTKAGLGRRSDQHLNRQVNDVLLVWTVKNPSEDHIESICTHFGRMYSLLINHCHADSCF